MAYAVKYILQFTSDRGNEIRIEVLKKDYQGEVIYKSLGGSPSLSIEQGDGAIKGSSLMFAMQADIEGELQELYTTDNKQFKVNMYRNEVLTWQGYILPELYSEEYVDAPYDVSVTATDQLATLKAITYQREDVNVSLSTIIEDILSFTQISVPVTYHQNLSALRKGEVPMLVDSHISQAAYNGYSCYDVLNNILLSCNCCIMQINGEWLITSLTNSTTNYYTAGVTQVREHKALGQLGVGEVCPAGTLTMVNNPALKGAKVEYAHMLRNSFLVNADCVDREGWNYTPDSRNPIDIPGEREAFGKIFKAYCWELHPVNIRENNSLQLWQEVFLEKDERNYYDLSVKTLFGTNAKLLLMAVTYLGSDGIERRLTAEGWIETWDKSDVNYYIQITGTNKNAGLDAIADIEQYEMSTVQFALPPVDGTMRVGFINSTTDYAEPLASAPIYVSQVYLTVSGVTGQECTTEVEPNATQEQQDVLLAYGDTFESENAYKLGLNTLKKSSGENITSWWLDNVNFSSYYEAMLQEFSRYFGVKKAQLQGIIMGKDVLSNIYTDVFSGRVMRLLTAQVDLLTDEASVTVEEIVTTTVNFDTVIYATNNTNSFGSSSGGSSGTSGGSSSTAGESLLGVQSDGDVYVKDGRALVGQEGRFENLAMPVVAPLERAERKTYVYASNPDRGAIDLEKIAKYIEDQEALWVLDKENSVIRTRYNVVSEQEIISGRRASGSGSGGGGGISEITAQMIADALGYVPYSSLNPAGYITSASLSGYATEAWVRDNYQPKGNYLTSVSWDIVGGKPTTLGGYGITDAVKYIGGASVDSARHSIGYDNESQGSVLPDGGGGGFISADQGAYGFQIIGNAYTGQLYRRGIYNNELREWKAILDADNYSSYALPLSGGTISGDLILEYALYGQNMYFTNNPNGELVLSPMSWQNYDLGWYNGSAWNTLIHSGNIGSYAMRYYGTDMPTGIANYVGYGKPAQGWNTFGPAITWGFVNYYTELQMDNDSHWLYVRNSNGGALSDWKQIAFTDSNVASATKLQTGRYFWGNYFNGENDINNYIFMNSGGEGIYISYSGIAWHGSDNGWIASCMNFNSSGNVLIGTTDDYGYKLQVAGGIRTTRPIFGYMYGYNFNAAAFIFDKPGSYLTGIGSDGTTDTIHFGACDGEGNWVDYSQNWKFYGNHITTGEVISSRRATSSDARLKDNINRLIAEDCLAMVRNLQPSSWQWKEDGKFSLGFIAQDIEPLMPYAVTKIKDEVLGQRLNLQYDQFFAPVVGAIQCLDIKVNSHQDEIESLKNEVAELKQKLSKYETVWQ